MAVAPKAKRMTNELGGCGCRDGGVQLAAVLGRLRGPTAAPFTSAGVSKSEAMRVGGQAGQHPACSALI